MVRSTVLHSRLLCAFATVNSQAGPAELCKTLVVEAVALQDKNGSLIKQQWEDFVFNVTKLVGAGGASPCCACMKSKANSCHVLIRKAESRTAQATWHLS